MKKKFTLYAALLTAILILAAGNGWAQTTYTFSSKSWAASPANWTSKTDGYAYITNQGIQVTTGTNGACGNSPISFANVTSVKVGYCTNSSNGAGTINVFSVADANAAAQSGTRIGSSTNVSTTGGTTVRYLTFNTTSITGNVQIYVTCTTNSIYIYSVEITYAANDLTSKVVDPTAQIVAANIASTVTSSGSAVDAFKFKISDLATADALSTKVTQVKIAKSGTAVLNTAIAGAQLFDGVTQITTGTPVITANDITFPISSGNLDVTTGASREITLKVWLSATVTDNSTLVFSVPKTSHGFTADAAGSTFAADFGAAVTGNTMTIRVAATKLLFTTAPSTTACPNTNLTTPPGVSATDANGNVDTDFTGPVDLTNNASIGMTGYQVTNAAAGVASFPNLQFTATGSCTLSTSNSSSLTNAPATASITIAVINVTGQAATNGNALSSISWTNPSCLDAIMIVAKAGSAVTATPAGDGTAYTANLAFGTAGTDANLATGEYCLYKGTASPQTVTALTNGNTYYFTIFTRKGSSWSTGAQTTAAPALATAATDYFRSNSVTGNWGANATWQSSPTGTDPWITATATPTSAANTITILNGHTVTVAASVTADQLVVNTGGKIIVNSSQTLTVANGADVFDMNISGTVENSGTITATGAVKFQSGGYYKHTGNGNSMVVASWDAASTCEITGTTTATSISNIGSQVTDYGTLIWNCTSQTAWCSFANSFNTAGDFIVNSTGGGTVGINLINSTTSRTFNIGGNISINGAKLTLTASNGVATVNIAGNLTLSASAINQLDFGRAPTSYAPTGGGDYRSVVNLSGNFSNGAGSVVKINDNLYYGKLVFQKAGIQNYTNSNTTPTMNGINHVVNPGSTLVLNSNMVLSDYNTITVDGTLNSGTFKVDPAGSTLNDFLLSSGATLITASSTGVNGSIGAGGTITLNSGANYTFNGTAVQSTGTLLPATVNNLTIDNSGGSTGVTLTNSVTVNGTLAFTNGLLTTGSNVITAAGTITGADATKYVSGKLQRAIATGTNTYAYPVGTATGYTPVSLAFTSVGTGGNVTVNSTDGVGANYPAALNSTKKLARRWNITNSGVATFSADATCTYLSGDLVGGAAQGNLKAYKFDSPSTYTYPTTNTGTLSFTATGLTSFSELGAGESNISTTTTPADASVCQGATSVNLTATVSPDPGGGTVQFSIDGSNVGSPVAVSSGSASLNYNPSSLSSGSHTIHAVFSGYGDYLTSSSSPDKTLTVNAITASPVVSSPIAAGATTVSGTSEANAAITVYKAGNTSIGTATADGSGAWAAAVSAVALNDVITAKATATGKCESSVSNGVTTGFGSKTSTTAGDWGVNTNWTPEGVPTATDDVIIQQAIVITGNADCHNLVVNPGSVQVKKGGSLIVHGSSSGMPSVELGLLGGDAFQLFTPPVMDGVAHAIDFFTGAYLDKYIESSGEWLRLVNQDVVPAHVGYSINYAAPKTLVFSGSIYTSDQTFTTTFTNGAPGYGAGWNLVGNPFTSAVDLALGSWNYTNTDNYIYVWDAANNNFLTGPTQKPADAKFTYGTLTGNIIPAMQGFFVHNTAAGSFTVPAAARKHSNQVFYKSATAETEVLRLSIEGNSYSDKAIVAFNPAATRGFDGQYDAYKLMGGEAAPQLYSMLSDGQIATVNSLPSVASTEYVPLGLKVGKTATYTLTVGGTETFGPSVPVRLDDLKLGTTQDLRLNPVYTFTASPGDAENRLRLRFATATGIDDPKAQGISIFQSQGNVVVRQAGTAAGTVYVYAATGALVAQQSLTPSETRLHQLAPGMYVVKVVTGKAAVSEKVVISQNR